jgi:hypothetical protein
MTPPQPAVGSNISRTESTGRTPAVGTGPFVINLCSSTTPMALEQPKLGELKQRFTFFVSRRREDGRERFRLHMGYFDTEAEAEEWLAVVRDIYPGAWTGEAPGKRLREREAAMANTASASAPPAGSPQPPPHVLAGIAKLQGPESKSGRTAVAKSAPVSVRSEIGRTSDEEAEFSVTFEPAPPTVAAPPPKPQPDLSPLMLAMLPASAPDAARSALVAASASAQAAMRMASPPPVLVVPTLQGAPQEAPPMANIPVLSANIPTVSAPTAAVARNVATTTAAAIVQKAPVRGAELPVPAAVTAPPRPALNVPVAAAATPPAAKAAPKAQLPVAKSMAPVARPVVTVTKTVGGTAKPAAAPAARPGKGVQPAIPKAAAKAPAKKGTNALSNVAEVLAALDETAGHTRQMPALSAAPVAPAASSKPSMTDTQVLKYLEVRRADGSTRESPDADGISLLRPDDTGTVRALKEAVTANAPVAFAVQLKFSVQPIELNQVPPLAIFSAYTLYTVEGSREGRKWYGLRLGFFTDAISAKQVAYYVRSEFASVAVVPVSPQERDRASDAGQGVAGSLQQKKHTPAPVDEFKLIDTMETPVLKKQVPSQPAPAAPKAAAAPAPKAAVKPAPPAANATVKRGKSSNKVRSRDRKSPQSLEETLEILGADQLEIDNGRGELLNDTGVRHLKVSVQKNSPFTRLLDRLSERVGKN